MFTGLIAATAVLVKLEKKNRPILTIRAALDKPLALGDSLAVNGVCLTLIEKKGDLLRFNLAVPTLRLSNLGDLPVGAALNIEFPVTADGLLGGHLVSGHIDGTVRTRAINKGDQNSRFIFSFIEREWKKFLILRGSVSLNGVSLTVSEISASWFAVEIIPHTLASTNLQFLRIGQRVNIELDLIGKYLYNFYQTKKGRIS
jgi:riboflavin synthase